MKKERKSLKDAEPETLLDRFAISLFSGFTALLAGLFAWFALEVIGISEWQIGIHPVMVVIGFSLLMAILGFLLLENIIINTIVTLWRWLGYLLGFFYR